METSVSYSAKSVRHNGGFTLLEVMVSISILTIGLVAIAALISLTSNNTRRSREMSIAAMLTSEKLEDLNRYPNVDPAVYAASGATAGSLTANSGPTSVTTGAGVTQNVSYWDQVQLSGTDQDILSGGTDGAVSETITGVNAGGATTYTTVAHKPDGTVSVATNTAAPTLSGTDALTFIRRWVIEKDPAGLPVGVRRITVLVSMQNASGASAVTFQESMVRP
jgi:prepilin-type N-terminal cleavage/methylation domain-containing protein